MTKNQSNNLPWVLWSNSTTMSCGQTLQLLSDATLANIWKGKKPKRHCSTSCSLRREIVNSLRIEKLANHVRRLQMADCTHIPDNKFMHNKTFFSLPLSRINGLIKVGFRIKMVSKFAMNVRDCSFVQILRLGDRQRNIIPLTKNHQKH